MGGVCSKRIGDDAQLLTDCKIDKHPHPFVSKDLDGIVWRSKVGKGDAPQVLNGKSPKLTMLGFLLVVLSGLYIVGRERRYLEAVCLTSCGGLLWRGCSEAPA